MANFYNNWICQISTWCVPHQLTLAQYIKIKTGQHRDFGRKGEAQGEGGRQEAPFWGRGRMGLRVEEQVAGNGAQIQQFCWMQTSSPGQPGVASGCFSLLCLRPLPEAAQLEEPYTREWDKPPLAHGSAAAVPIVVLDTALVRVV